MSSEVRKNKFALITIFLDYIDDILSEEIFHHEARFQVNKAQKAYKKVMSLAYGNQSFEELDEYKDEIIKKSLEIIKGKFNLR